MSNAWKRGSTRRWRQVRAWVLHRDHYQCQLKLAGCTGAAPLLGGHVHHTAGKQFGDDPALLVAACRSCNLATGDPTKQTDPPNRPITDWS
jgi:5-methylcytosine-specific restriction endonuclease McrA